MERQKGNGIKFGTNVYGEPKSKFKFTKYDDGDVLLQEYDPYSGLIKDSVYIFKEDIQTLIELLSK